MTSKAQYLDVSTENQDVTMYQKTESHIRPMKLIGRKMTYKGRRGK